jgi:hypothetical protein
VLEGLDQRRFGGRGILALAERLQAGEGRRLLRVLADQEEQVLQPHSGLWIPLDVLG